jgi:tetratricopeptide (TPR) repeat protein
MLFDLRGSGRRRTVQIVYISLAVIMGAGLVLFGIGGAVSGGLLDAITQGGGGASTGAGAFQKRVDTMQQATRANPKDAQAWAALARARFQLASAGDNYDQATGQYSPAGKQQLQAATDAWQQHLNLAGKHPDDGVAGVMVQAYISLNQYDKAVQAQEVITEARPTSKTFATLAILAYDAGQTRTGDLARQKALSLAPSDQRNTLKAQIDEAKTAAAAQSAQNAAPAPTPSATATPSGKKKSKK